VASSATAQPASGHDSSISAGLLKLDDDIEWPAFGVWMTMLLHRHGEDVLRVKGLLKVRGLEGPVAIHGVQHLVHPPEHLESWPAGAKRGSVVVVIARNLDIGRLECSLAVFNRAAGAIARRQRQALAPVMHGVGSEVGGRPYRRRGGLAWAR
jgi:G3E family GTPase